MMLDKPYNEDKVVSQK